MTPSEGSVVGSEAVGPGGSFLADVVDGLSARPKRLSPKYFYDHAGSVLFDRICELPEYYLTRAEAALLDIHLGSIVSRLPARCRIIEPGAGSGSKTRLLLRALGRQRCRSYMPVDIARDYLLESAARMRADLEWLEVVPVVADFVTDFTLPPRSEGVDDVVFFPGSTIGNFDPADAARLLTRFRRIVGPRGCVLLGVDLKKSPALLHAAYNDADGVTAAFNKNLLLRMNRELGANFDLAAFEHYALYDPVAGRIEMHLVSRFRQTVTIAGLQFTFADGESLCTERSYKYDLPSAALLAQRAGLVLGDAWCNHARSFALLLLRPCANQHGHQ
jgi:dimethylhistidine N-methyltransferase